MSKSKYCKGVQCPKILWMDDNMPDKATATASEAILQTGTEVGILARDYFEGCETVEIQPDKQQMCNDTAALMEKGVQVIAEASFQYGNQFCSVDLLCFTEKEVQLIEVKSSTEVHDIYFHDMAYQYYVLTHCGISVTAVINMHINNAYVRKGDLELSKLFTLEDCTEQVLTLQPEIEENLARIEACRRQSSEPVRQPGIFCDKPYECAYKAYCLKDIPEPSIFSIHRLLAKKKYEYFHQGIVSFDDIIERQPKLNDKQWRQVYAAYHKEPPAIDKEAVRAFLDTLTYPVYHLDFETFQQAIPQFDGVKPYMQIPFQYSLHVQQAPGAEAEHYEFLGKEGTDPRRALAEQLCKQIPADGCGLAFNMAFEQTVIRNLAELYEDLSEHLMSICNHMHDLMVPFQQQSYYCREMEGSYSIKKVLPALCAGDPELDYHALEEIHNGSEAMNAFADLVNHSEEEIARIRKNLLAYCRLDTLAMVKILEKLYDAVK